MTKCPNCGTENDVNSIFCLSCGTKLERAKPKSTPKDNFEPKFNQTKTNDFWDNLFKSNESKHCQFCGKKISARSYICPYCGSTSDYLDTTFHKVLVVLGYLVAIFNPSFGIGFALYFFSRSSKDIRVHAYLILIICIISFIVQAWVGIGYYTYYYYY